MSRTLVAIVGALFMLTALWAGPLQAVDARLLIETASLAFFAEVDGAKHPKKSRITQMVSSAVFEDLETIGVALRYEHSVDDDSDSPGSASINGKASASCRLLKANGQSFKLGTVKAKASEDENDFFGVKVMTLPAPLEKGDVLVWTVKLKKFSDIQAGDEIDIMVAVADPIVLEL